MDKSKVKEILIRAMSVGKADRRYNGMKPAAAYRSLKCSMKRSGKGELYNGFYLVEEAYSEVRRKRLSHNLRYLVGAVLPYATKDNLSEVVSAFFETVSDELSSDECEAVRQALLMLCIVDLAKGRMECLELIRTVKRFDFTPFMLGFVKYEQILRRDPIYASMDKESKSLYKEKIKKYSAKRGITFTEGCERLMSEAIESGCHIGELLPFQKGEAWWLVLPCVIFAVLIYLPLRMLWGEAHPIITALALILLAPPLWQTSFELFVPIVARFRRSEILPRLDLPKIPKESAVLTVITALGTNVSEVKRLFERLEILSLKTRSRGRDEYAFWGVLLDLPNGKATGGDESVIEEARRQVDRLNGLYSCRFALFTRERVWDEAEGVFTAHERKRGAVIALVKLLSHKSSSIITYGAELPRIKYVLTLDSDTDMELGALNKLVGTMEHPINRPVIENRRGVNVVTGGFGILQPATVTDLESVHKTGFSTLLGGSGGVDSYHSAIFNLNSVLFGKGIFCGKGMLDVEAFDKTVCDAFPDGRILSHDILEGTRLRTGYTSDVCFFDSVPSNGVSFYNRSHRWVRGDIQALPFIRRRIDTPEGKRDNPMRFSERFVFISNVLNIATPVCQVLGLLLLMRYGAELFTDVSFFFVLPCFVPLLNELLRTSFLGSVKNIIRRFFGDTLTAICREVIMTGYRLASMAFVAYKNSDAVIRALWRMRVSGKKLLEWTTAGQSEGIKHGIVGIFVYTLPSFGLGVLMLTLARLPLCKLLGILWCVFFIVVYGLNKAIPVKGISPKHKRMLVRYASDMWRYFDKYADQSNNWLPPDNVSVFPSSETACRTSPTNIGLYLLSVLSALDLSFITASQATDRIERAVESIERLPKYRGQLYNWYSTVTLDVIGQEYISTVDSGNFVTCLVALYQGLGEYESKDKRITALRQRIKRIELESDFRFLFNSAENLFALGFFVDTEQQDGIMYDMYMSEARTTDYYAIARGVVRDSHWQTLSRPLITSASGVGVLSWSGTCFEYFMPHLLLPIYKNSFAFETLSYAFSEQVKNSSVYNRERVFGISESGYYAFDESLGYQYRAFGIPSLSRRSESLQAVISPYSSFLMLPVAPAGVMKNLDALKRVGMYGEYGFYEALDMTPSRVGSNPSVVKSFMSHHVGMSIVACVNAVKDDIFVKRFMSDIEMNAVSELLREAVPANAMGIKKEKLQAREVKPRITRPEKKDSAFGTQATTRALTGRESSAVFFERGVVSLDLTCKGERISAVRPIDSTHCCAIYLFGCIGDKTVSPSVSADVSYSFNTECAEYRQSGLRSLISLSAKSCATRIRLEAQAESGAVGMYFEPLLTDFISYASHPAFSDLFFEAEYTNGVLILSRSGEKPFSLAVVSNSEYTFEVSRERVFDRTEFGFDSLENGCRRDFSCVVDGIITSPCVFVKSKFKARTDTTFVIGWGRTKSEALKNAREEAEIPESRSFKLSRELFFSALTASGGAFEEQYSASLLSCLRPADGIKFSSSFPDIYGKGGVYSLGISGKYPVFLVKKGVALDDLAKLLLTHKLHYIMGLRYELLVETEGGGYSGGGKAELEGIAEELQCGFLIGRDGGIRFVDTNSFSEHMLNSLATGVYPDERRLKRYGKRDAFAEVEAGEPIEGDVVISEKPSVQWSHIIATPTFGTMVTHRSLGNTWVYNSRLSRLTYWENSSVGGGYSEKVYLERDGRRMDLCASAYGVRYECGRAEYIGRYFNVRVTVHPTLLFKAVSVSCEGRDMSVFYSFLAVLGDFPSPTCRVEYYKDSKNSVVFRNLFSDSLDRGFGYLMMPFENDIITDDGFGVYCERGGEVVFVLGYAGSKMHYEAVRRYFDTRRFSDLYMLYATELGGRLKNERNFWIAYQTLVSRFYARSGPYQSGGAWGFRDQAQDCLTVIDVSPQAVRSHICRMASHQYREGDVQHWWHNGRGVRTHCSDDYLWLVWLVCMYVTRTKDKSILGVKVSYLVSRELCENERDRYESPERTKEGYTVLHHMTSALDLLCKRGLGSHSLPFILGGDWNDGMNMLPSGTESVWLGFFARIVIHAYTELTGDESYLGFYECIRQGIEENAFFSDRYARAFMPDGRVLGAEGAEHIEIDALPQAFAALCHAVTGDGVCSRITLALDTAWEKLYDDEKGIFKLFTPPLTGFDKEIGYISSYPEGVRENGGQYTHAAAWMGLACLYAPERKEENRRRAELLASILNPKNHPTEVYKIEPYVLAGDVYTSGRGGWSWYTGSAAWYRELILRISDKRRNNSPPLA